MSQAALIALLTAVVGTIGYHLAQRQVAPDANPALVLTVAYLVGAAMCGLLLVTALPVRANLRAQLNWPALALGVAVVLIEVGFLWMYRSGWTLASGALMVNILATLALTTIGVLVFGERLHWTTVVGAVICLVGIGVMQARGAG